MAMDIGPRTHDECIALNTTDKPSIKTRFKNKKNLIIQEKNVFS